jgi:hypothetical protein
MVGFQYVIELVFFESAQEFSDPEGIMLPFGCRLGSGKHFTDR